MTRIAFLISSLNRGGAEHQLTQLVKEIDQNKFDVTVVTIYDGGPLLTAVESIPGIEVVSLGKKGRGDYVRPVWRLFRTIIRIRPQIMHGYMGVSNILSLLVGKPLGAKVVWGLRASNLNFAFYDRLSSWYFRLAAGMSRFPDLIIANSFAGKSYHIAEGYSGQRMIVVPNGFDVERFRSDRALGSRVRDEWGIPPRAILIGLAARLDPMKDHATFLKAAALLSTEFEHVHFVCIGNGTSSYRRHLEELGRSLGLENRLTWAGERGDMPAVHNALDIATSSSSGEGFSNTIGEAMACGVPCVVTDVGDSAFLVGSTGISVPKEDPASLASAWRSLLEMPSEERTLLGQSARQRIVDEFSLEVLARRTETALLGLMNQAN